ncbi:hypothetical protein ANO11243_013250 [Dothideomycetidae sp. 11243]|nr:hypothetical protein ANO11243_013250 [fungal sp. No.11243]
MHVAIEAGASVICCKPGRSWYCGRNTADRGLDTCCGGPDGRLVAAGHATVQRLCIRERANDSQPPEFSRRYGPGRWPLHEVTCRALSNSGPRPLLSTISIPRPMSTLRREVEHAMHIAPAAPHTSGGGDAAAAACVGYPCIHHTPARLTRQLAYLDDPWKTNGVSVDVDLFHHSRSPTCTRLHYAVVHPRVFSLIYQPSHVKPEANTLSPKSPTPRSLDGDIGLRIAYLDLPPGHVYL